MGLTRSDMAAAKTAILVGIAILLSPVVLVICVWLYTSYVPAHSAEVHIAEADATVRLDFYWVWDEMADNGRYLTVTTPVGWIRQNVCGFDWAHWSRTSVYLTETRGIAVLGPDHCDYLFRLPLHKIERAFQVPSEGWIYLGAFELRSDGMLRRLRFVPATEERECIPMPGGSLWYDWAPRNQARRARCNASDLRADGRM